MEVPQEVIDRFAQCVFWRQPIETGSGFLQLRSRQCSLNTPRASRGIDRLRLFLGFPLRGFTPAFAVNQYSLPVHVVVNRDPYKKYPIFSPERTVLNYAELLKQRCGEKTS